MNPSADTAMITLPAVPEGAASVDVCFDGVRVWSIDLRAATMPDDRKFPWPAPLVPYLTGTTEVTVADSGSRLEYGRFTAVFDESSLRTAVLDEEGIPLSINKWGRLGKTLGAGNPGIQERILARTSEIIKVLEGFGLRPFIVGGTLLGAVRDGALLPHDDDADVAYLSAYSHPADIAREGFAVGHHLQNAGYELVRHSATHMQLYFRDSSGTVDHYVDVFTAFYTADGLVNQPFHVRGELPLEAMLPFSAVEIDGWSFPAPAKPEAWLEINYDENWRTPIPGYQLNTPRNTKRRFDAWFGAFHFQRDFWNDWFAENGGRGDEDWLPGRRWVAGQNLRLTAPTLLDLGAGSGKFSCELARLSPTRRVIAADFAHAATALTKRLTSEASVETAHVNLYRTLSLATPQSLNIHGPFDVVAVHLLDQTGHLARANALRLMRMALRSGGSAVATLFGMPTENVSFDDPTTWHLARHDLVREAKELGLGTEFTLIEDDPTSADNVHLPRAPYGARFFLNDQPFPKKEESLRQRLKRLFLRARPQSSQEAIKTLTERVSELEQELDEYRRDSLRIAELMDLAEQRLTPPKTSQDAPPTFD